MYWRYGAHRHPDNEVNLVSFQQFPVFSPRGERRTARYRATIMGELQYSSQATLTTKINELINAYAYDGNDAGLFQDDGTLTNHHLLNTASCVSGVRVMYRDWPQGDPAEYATKRTFRVILEAEYLEPDSQITEFEETLIFQSDGGPHVEVYDVKRGPPIAVELARRTAQRIIQSGKIVGLQGYPLGVMPGPLFPANEHRHSRIVRVGSPRKYGNLYLDYPISYQYRFSLATPVNAFPNII